MKFILSWTVFLCFAIKFVKNDPSIGSHGEQNRSSAIFAEVLSDSLTAQQWEENEKPCLNAMMSILDNAKNFTLWAVWVLDANQPPVGQLYGQKYHLGNYDQCFKPDFGFRVGPNTPKTQYCIAEVNLTGPVERSKPIDYIGFDYNVTTDAYLKKPTKHGRGMSKMIWGVCIPEVCQPSSVAKITRSLLQVSHLGPLSDAAGVNVTRCETREVMMAASSGSSVFNEILPVRMLTYSPRLAGGLASAVYWLQELPTLLPVESILKLGKDRNLLDLGKEWRHVVVFLLAIAILCTCYVKSGKAAPDTFVGELANSFNLSRNLSSLTEVREDEVYSMNAMRVLTSFAVVFVHYVLIIYTHLIVNGLDQEKSQEEGGEMSSHIEVIVDTFLTLSGLLFVRGLFTDKAQNPLKFIWKRYIRLITAMAALMFYITTAHTAAGPIWDKTVDTWICKENWLINFLMISNFFVDKMCVLVSWYVPCDYQLCVFATILYFIYKKNNTLGKFTFAVSFVAAMVIPGVLTYKNGLAPLLFHGVDSMANCRFNPEFIHFYVKSYCRAGPFLVGAMMGYIMYNYKPKDHRNIIGTFSSFLGLILSLMLMHQILVIGHLLYMEGEPLDSAIYVAFNRTLWGLAVCVIIGVSEYGNLSILNTAFSWYPLVPISRLTYGVYLTHFLILELMFCTVRTTVEYDMFSMCVGSAGTIVYSLLASLVIWLLFEAPVINVSNMLLNKTWKNKAVKSIQLNKNNVHEKTKLT